MEKHKQYVYKEDCLWLMAQANMAEDKRHLLKQPHLSDIETKQKKIDKVPYKTLDETLDFIFEGIE